MRRCRSVAIAIGVLCISVACHGTEPQIIGVYNGTISSRLFGEVWVTTNPLSDYALTEAEQQARSALSGAGISAQAVAVLNDGAEWQFEFGPGTVAWAGGAPADTSILTVGSVVWVIPAPGPVFESEQPIAAASEFIVEPQ